MIPAARIYRAKIDAKIESHKPFISPPLRLKDNAIMELSQIIQLTPRQQ